MRCAGTPAQLAILQKASSDAARSVRGSERSITVLDVTFALVPTQRALELNDQRGSLDVRLR
jgi:hypothetical protein